MDTISVLVGFLIGVIATAIAVEFGLKKIFRPPVQSKVTGQWRLDEHRAPLVVAQDTATVGFPTGARVVTAGAAHPDALTGRDYRRNPNARSNYIVATDRDRATLFLGPIQEGTLALATVDPAIVARLRAEHRRLWETGEPLVEEAALGDAVRHAGMLVRTRGRVQDCVPYRDRHLLRVTDQNATLGVLVDEPLELTGQTISVMGRVIRGTTGYPLIDAEEVRVVTVDGTRPARAALAPPAPAPLPPTERRAPPAQEPRVLRVPDPRSAQNKSPPVEPEPEPGPVMEFEAAEDAPTEAERKRLRARVVVRR
jgi:hypothetical protein